MASVFLEVLTRCLDELDIKLGDRQLSQCEKYYLLLIDWNQRMNLTSLKDPQEIAIKHFIDSLICMKYVNIHDKSRLIDIGTGAGFPGIPIKIFFPEMKVVLLDSLAKRCQFLKAVVETLNLNHVTVIHGRAEEMAKNSDLREKFSLATARAVTNLSVLAEYCLPFVEKEGWFFALKGPGVEDELNQAENAIVTLGGRLQAVKYYQLPLSEDQRSIILVQKKQMTPDKYPRKPGIPEKKPI